MNHDGCDLPPFKCAVLHGDPSIKVRWDVSDDVKRKEALGLIDRMIETGDPAEFVHPQMNARVITTGSLKRLRDLLDPPPKEPEIWAARRTEHGGTYRTDCNVMSREGDYPPAPPWLGPERERVSVTKWKETDDLLDAVRKLEMEIQIGEKPSTIRVLELRKAIRAFDAAHKART